ncbi:MAG TPA: TonB family protein [Terriglobales bacterium]|nr:TonB family protein [Terriglobales bacterium]
MAFQALLFCPDEKTARVTTQVLTELEFSVEASTEPFAAVKKLMGQHFDAIVVDCENEQNASLLFKSARNSSSNQTALAVAVVEGQAGVANAFRIGANLVLTKPINVEQAKSTLRVARGLLKKGTDGAKPILVQPASAPEPAPPVPAARPSSQPATTRSVTAPPPATPKPAFGVFPSPKTQPATTVARTRVEAGGAFDVEQEPTPAPEPAEEILLESMEENSPAIRAPQAGKPPLPGLAESVNKQIIESKAQGSKSPVRTPVSIPDSRPGIIRGHASAAAAPAPARENRESASAIEKGFPTAPAFENQRLTRSVAAAAASAFPPSRSLAAPSFGSLDDDDAASDGGSKKRILVGVAAILLVAAGYFGYTKFHKKTVAQPPVEVQSQPAAPGTTTVSDTSSASVEQQLLAQAPQQMRTEPASGAAEKTAAPRSSAQDGEADSATADVEDARPATKTMIVKGGSSRAKTPEEVAVSSEVPAPPALGNVSGADQRAISSIVQSATPAAVPKVAPTEMLKVSQGVTQGLLLNRVQPTYPRQALQMHLQGAVQMQAVIGKDGVISTVRILSGEPILARAAADAVLQWKYKPYLLDGEPVDIQTQITVNFKLP